MGGKEGNTINIELNVYSDVKMNLRKPNVLHSGLRRERDKTEDSASVVVGGVRGVGVLGMEQQ